MVAIKDFGMPSCCVNCDICLPCALDEGLCHITQKTLSDIYNKRDSDCPLIEIEQSDDCVSRTEILKEMAEREKNGDRITLGYIKNMPPVTPIHGTCKDCKHYKKHANNGYCSKRVNVDSHTDVYRKPNYYCALFERRG